MVPDRVPMSILTFVLLMVLLGRLAGAATPTGTSGAGPVATAVPPPTGDPLDGARYGFAIDGDDEWLFVSRDGEAVGGTPAAGAVRVLRRTPEGRWTHVQRLTAPTPWADARFGMAIAFDGESGRLVVGAPFDGGNGSQAGAAFVFERSGDAWQFRQRIHGAGGDAGDWFGISAAIDGDRVVVGARRAEGAAGMIGAAYVFERNSFAWIQRARLEAADPQDDSDFGHAVAMHGDVIAVGAHGRDQVRGGVHVFEVVDGSWTETQFLRPSVVGPQDWFGVAVDAGPDRILVGARRFDVGGVSRTGAGWVYDRGAGGVWEESAMLVAPNPDQGGELGSKVSLDGDQAVLGAWLETTLDGNTGAVHLFQRSEGSPEVWTHRRRHVAPVVGANASIGHDVLVHDGIVHAGSFQEDVDAVGDGRVWRFEPIARCQADLDGDGTVTMDDLIRFLGGRTLRGPTIDFDRDGDIDLDDLTDYVRAWKRGCD